MPPDKQTGQAMDSDIFEVLLLTGRPASGKSEIIHHLLRTPPDLRRARYRIGELDVLDDFPMLWTWFEEDDLLERRFGQPRLHSDPQGYFLDISFWHLLVERLSLEYGKRLRQPDYHARATCLVEFSRGRGHGGYQAAFQHLSDELLARAAVLYVRVSFEESLRKNRARYNPERPDSILEHGLSDEKMDRLYREDDWQEYAPGEAGFVQVRRTRLPYVVFENQDDVTTDKPDLLEQRLQMVLGQLWEMRVSR